MRYQQPQSPTLLDASNPIAARVIGGCVPGVFSLRNGGASSVKSLGLNPWGVGSAGGSGNYATAAAAEVLKGRAAGASASNRDITFVFAGTVTSNNTIWFYDGQSDGGSSWWFKTDASGNLSASYGQSSNIAGTVPIPTGFVVLICHGGTNGGQVARTWVNGVEYAGTAATDSWPGSPAFTGMFGSSAFPTGNTFSGVGNLAVALRGNITSAEAKELTNNLWQLFEDADEDAIFLAPLASGSTGTSATTNANDTSSASGTTTITGTSAKTNANDTSSASGTTTVVGSSATTNAADTSSASGSVGNACTGTVAVTNAADTSSAAGTTTVKGSSARTNANDSSAASGTTTVLGTVAATNSADTSTAAGYVGSITGTAAATNLNDTALARGVGPSVDGGGGHLVHGWQRRKTRKQIEEERIALGIIPAPVAKIAEKIAAKAIQKAVEQREPDVLAWVAEREQQATYARQMRTEMARQNQAWDRAYERLIQLAIEERIQNDRDNEEDEVLLLLL